MATTPGGLPYPVGTDFVVDGDNAIKALAETIETKYGTGVRVFSAFRGGVFADGQVYGAVLTETVASATVPAYTYTLGTSGDDLGRFTALQAGIYAFTLSAHFGENAPAGSWVECAAPGIPSMRGYATSGNRSDWVTCTGHFRADGATKPKFAFLRNTGGNTRDISGTLTLVRLRSL